LIKKSEKAVKLAQIQTPEDQTLVEVANPVVNPPFNNWSVN
jgi:hypothetical protein